MMAAIAALQGTLAPSAMARRVSRRPARDVKFRANLFDSVAGAARARSARRGALLPQPCALCAAPCGDALGVRGLRRRTAAARSGVPAAARCRSPGGAICGRCLARPPPWDAARAAFAYAYPLDRLVQRMKYRGVLAYADFLAGALAACVDQ